MNRHPQREERGVRLVLGAVLGVTLAALGLGACASCHRPASLSTDPLGDQIQRSLAQAEVRR